MGRRHVMGICMTPNVTELNIGVGTSCLVLFKRELLVYLFSQDKVLLRDPMYLLKALCNGKGY